MPLPDQNSTQPIVNNDFLKIRSVPKYVFDQLNYPREADMKEDVFLSTHPCFSKVTVTSQGEYLLTCAVSAEKVISAIADLDQSEQQLTDRAVETLKTEFIKITDSIRYVNSHFNVEFESQAYVILLIDYFLKIDILLPLSFTYLNIVLLEEKLMQFTNKMFSQLAEEKLKEGAEGVDKATLNLKLVPRMQDFGALKRVQNELLSRHTRLKNENEEDEEGDVNRSGAPLMMYT